MISTNTLGASRTNNSTFNGTNSVARRTYGATNQLTFGLNATTNPTTVDPIITEIHAKILDRLGGGGFKAIGRSFRMMDADGNNKLSPSEIQNGFRQCGIELSTSDVRRLFAVADRNGDGAIDAKEFLRVLRGPLPRARVKVVDDAWKTLNPNGTNKVPIGEVVAKYCAKLHPSVTKQEKSEEQIRGEFEAAFTGAMCDDSGLVSREEFLDYYAGISDSIENHELFDITVRNEWRLDQPNNFNKTDKDHHKYIVSQFQSSAYRGCTGAFPAPDAEDNVGVKRQPRFASMISNDLVPYPMHKIGQCPANVGAGVYLGASVKAHKTNTKDIAEKCPDVTLDFDKSATGKVPGMATSRGFIDITTSTATMHGEFNDDVMNAFDQGKARERQSEAERIALQTTAFNTPDPSVWTRSSDAYADYRKVDRSQFTATNAVPKLAHGEANRTKTQQMMEAGRNVDMDALRQQCNTTHANSLPRGFQPRPAHQLTTMKDHFAGYDPALGQESNDRWASVPLQHRHQVATDDERAAYAAQQERFARRNEGDYNTEKADKHSNLYDKAEISHTYDVKGAFCIRNGVRCLSEKVHKPRNVETGMNITGGTIVPGQFTSMASKPLHTPQ